MKICAISIFVENQDEAEQIYNEGLGFKLKHNIAMGTQSTLTAVSGEDPDGTELLLQHSDRPAVSAAEGL